VIFIDFIIRFIVINVQIGRVRKHGNKTFTIRSIPCPTILNDIDTPPSSLMDLIVSSKVKTMEREGVGGVPWLVALWG
jgi:hypothetical protein